MHSNKCKETEGNLCGHGHRSPICICLLGGQGAVVAGVAWSGPGKHSPEQPASSVQCVGFPLLPGDLRMADEEGKQKDLFQSLINENAALDTAIAQCQTWSTPAPCRSIWSLQLESAPSSPSQILCDFPRI